MPAEESLASVASQLAATKLQPFEGLRSGAVVIGANFGNGAASALASLASDSIKCESKTRSPPSEAEIDFNRRLIRNDVFLRESRKKVQIRVWRTNNKERSDLEKSEMCMLQNEG
ncbi:hypothetical protein L596_008268 [Steinernema carpocapsae]|nr:hypothetical protein L596_008268 [Steinernema carpocapsae]